MLLLGRVGICARLSCRQGLSLSLGLVIPVWASFFWWQMGLDCLPHGLEQQPVLKWPLPRQARTLPICHRVRGVLLSWKCFPHSASRIKCFSTHFDAQTVSQIKCRFACFSSPVPAGFQSHCRGQKWLLVHVDNELKFSVGFPWVCVCCPFSSACSDWSVVIVVLKWIHKE